MRVPLLSGRRADGKIGKGSKPGRSRTKTAFLISAAGAAIAVTAAGVKGVGPFDRSDKPSRWTRRESLRDTN